MLSNYIDEDGDYDEDEFDLKLLKLINKLSSQTSNQPLNLFSEFKNVFILEERRAKLNGNDDSIDLISSQLTRSLELNEQRNNAFLEINENISDYLQQILLKCGGHVISRMKFASMLIAVDKLLDYDEELESKEIQAEQSYFRDCVNRLKETFMERSSKHLQILSSDWVIDSVLGMELAEKKNYVLHEFKN